MDCRSNLQRLKEEGIQQQIIRRICIVLCALLGLRCIYLLQRRVLSGDMVHECDNLMRDRTYRRTVLEFMPNR